MGVLDVITGRVSENIICVCPDALAVLHLPELGIGEEHYDAVRRICEEMKKQGIPVKYITK